jgi:hypothetical protein
MADAVHGGHHVAVSISERSNPRFTWLFQFNRLCPVSGDGPIEVSCRRHKRNTVGVRLQLWASGQDEANKKVAPP